MGAPTIQQIRRGFSLHQIKKIMITIKSKKIHAPTMDDDGENYFSTFEYQELGDQELYGADEWRTGRIVWPISQDFKSDMEDMQKALADDPQDGWDFDSSQWDLLEDESQACDWDELEVFNEDGELVEDEAAICKLSEMV